MKLINDGGSYRKDGVEVQVSLNDVQIIVKEHYKARRDAERMVKATLDLSSRAGILAAHTSQALYGNKDLDPALVFIYSKDVLKILAELAIACGYELDDIGTAILRESALKDASN